VKNNGRQNFKVSSLLKESLLVAAVALVLALPLIGFRTAHGDTGLEWEFRWIYLAIAVGLVFIGRALLVLVRQISWSTKTVTLGPKPLFLIRKHRLSFLTVLISLTLVLP
ncbi:uncharacterized protein METZ01_LOCUS356869, partial [marine metagenome]